MDRACFPSTTFSPYIFIHIQKNEISYTNPPSPLEKKKPIWHVLLCSLDSTKFLFIPFFVTYFPNLIPYANSCGIQKKIFSYDQISLYILNKTYYPIFTMTFKPKFDNKKSCLLILSIMIFSHAIIATNNTYPHQQPKSYWNM